VLFCPSVFFYRIVADYKGNYKVRRFSCWNQLMCMMFGQLSNCYRLSDLMLIITTTFSNAVHAFDSTPSQLGVGTKDFCCGG
jgi:hypothetical protein